MISADLLFWLSRRDLETFEWSETLAEFCILLVTGLFYGGLWLFCLTISANDALCFSSVVFRAAALILFTCLYWEVSRTWWMSTGFDDFALWFDLSLPRDTDLDALFLSINELLGENSVSVFYV